MAENVARSFSNGKSVDSIETEKSRVILHELEMGWWLLAVCIYVLNLPSLIDFYRIVRRFDPPSNIL